MKEFVDHSQGTCQSLEELAEELARQFNADVPEWQEGDPLVGVHVAGYSNGEPDFWHVHNGPSDTVNTVDPSLVNANHDWNYYRDKCNVLTIRNGDFRRYAIVAEMLEIALDGLKQHFDTEIPRDPDDLFLQLRLLKLHVKIVSELWGLSDGPQSIGEPLWGMIIQDEKIIHFDEDDIVRTHEIKN